MIDRVMGFYSGDLNPHFFSYPSFQMYLLFGVYSAYYLLGRIGGEFGSVHDLISAYAINPSPFFLMSRGLSALLGTFSILVLFQIAKRFFDRTTSFLAAFFLAFGYLHVRDSHFGTTDVAVTFFVLMSYLFIARAARGRAEADYILAGLFAGLATSTKYMGLLLWAPLLWVHIKAAPVESGGLRDLFDRRLLKFGLAFLIFFLVGTPFVITDSMVMGRDFLREIRAVWLEREGLDIGWIYHLKISLRHGLGLTMMMAALGGVWVWFRQSWKDAVALLSFPVLYYSLMGKGFRDFVRYAIPLVPFLCLAAASFVTYFHGMVSRRAPSVLRRPLLWGLAILTIAPSLQNVGRFDALLRKMDTRLEARQYVEEAIPAGSSIAEFHVTFGELDLHPTVQMLEQELDRQSDDSIRKIYLEARREQLQTGKVRGYELWDYDSELKQFVGDGISAQGLPDYLVVQHSPLHRYNPTLPEEIAQAIPERYALKKEFVGVPSASGQNVFNELDALYLPFAGFVNVESTGPDIFIYERLDHRQNSSASLKVGEGRDVASSAQTGSRPESWF